MDNLELAEEAADIQHTLNGRGALDQRQAAAGAAGATVRIENQADTAAIHERELTRVEHDVLEPGVVELVQLRLQCSGTRYVKLAGESHAHGVALRADVDVKRGRVVPTDAGDDGCASSNNDWL